MRLELRSIISPGDLKNERLTFRALSDLDVGDFLIAQSDFIDGGPTTHFDHTYWFPYKPIEKGDLVVVYTKVGVNRERVLEKGHTAHFFYWDLNKTIWDEVGKGALVLHAPTWQSASASELIRT